MDKLIQLLPLIFALGKAANEFLAAERARTGLTNKEIFERAGVKLSENEQKLLSDLAQ